MSETDVSSQHSKEPHIPKKNCTELFKQGHWYSLSPIAVLYFAASIVKHLFSQALYLAPGAIVGISKAKDHPELVIPILCGLAILWLVIAWLKYLFFRFKISENHLEIRSGIIRKSHLDIPFSRIQNIRLERPLYYRLTGYVGVLLDTAGSNQEEAHIVALSEAQAESLKNRLQQQPAQNQNTDVSKAPNDSLAQSLQTDETVINQRTLPDLVIHGLTSNRVWIMLGALAPFYERISQFIFDQIAATGIDLQQMLDTSQNPWWQVLLYSVTITMLIMLLMAILSIVGAIMAFYGFTLSHSQDKLFRRSGLLTRHEVSLNLSRIQTAVYAQDWLDRLIGRINLKLEQNNAGYSTAGNTDIHSKLLIPSVNEQQAQLITEIALPNHQLSTVKFNPISARYILRKLVFPILPLTAVALSVSWMKQSSDIAIIAFGVATLCTLLCVLRWYRWGYQWDEEFIYIRKGLFGFDRHCFPIFKVQQTRYHQSWLMKQARMCSIECILASGGSRIPFIPEEVGQQIINFTLYRVESVPKSWM